MSDVKGGRSNDRLAMSGGREPDAPAGRPPELRLLMAITGVNQKGGCRWVTANGHPGRCGEDHWHKTAEAALRCFKGGKP